MNFVPLDEVNVIFTTDDIRRRSNLPVYKTMSFTKIFLILHIRLYYIPFGPLADYDGFRGPIPGSY